MQSTRSLFALATLLLMSGCNAVLGLDQSQLAPADGSVGDGTVLSDASEVANDDGDAPTLEAAPGDMGPALGTTCTADTDCGSSHCVDGVCCDTACTGQCESCAVAGSVGTCSAVTGTPLGGRPSCTGDGSSCSGVCDGTMRAACAYPPTTQSCRGASCTSGVATAGANCDGGGHCPAAAQTTCTPFLCVGSVCGTSCSSNSDCVSGLACNGSICGQPLDNGSACSTSNICKSGNCVDSFCCESTCTGQCQTCAAPGNLGKCVQQVGAPAGSRAPCTTDGSTCAGSCTAASASACTYPPTTATCGAPTCSAGTATATATCDGAGKCKSAPTQTCAPYVCGATACITKCATDKDCVAGEYCTAAGACTPQLPNGSPATSADQCSSSHLVDGVCCDAACTGQCESCKESGLIGTCSQHAGNPVAPRAACGSDGSLCGGTCGSSSRAVCTYPTTSTECVNASCSAGVASSAVNCDGAGHCPAPTSSMCPGGFACASATACATSCSTNAGCGEARSCCTNACLSVMSDNANCGQCGLACVGQGTASTPGCTKGTCTLTYAFVGAEQYFVVPAGVTSVTITANGAQGGSNCDGEAGGLGASVTATLSVTPGETLALMVGGMPTLTACTMPSAGGFNGGGAAGASAYKVGGGGGGASDVRQGAVDAGSSLANRVIVAGGGGGSGAGNGVSSGGIGGAGGTTNGGNGNAGVSDASAAGEGGSQSAGGAAGLGAPGGTGDPPGSPGNGGALGIGGTSGGGDGGSGGGGGGGYYGGGGGGGIGDFPRPVTSVSGGGGGGSSYVTLSATGVSATGGSSRCTGNGTITVTY